MIRLVTCCVLALALAIAAGAGADAQPQYVPATDSQQIVAYFGSTLLPAWLPPGYVYSRWDPITGSADALGDYLNVYFGDHGQRLSWTVDLSADPQEVSHIECSAHPDGHKVKVNGRTVVYFGAANGQTATLCLAGHTAVTVYDRYGVSAATLERIVASAAPAG